MVKYTIKFYENKGDGLIELYCVHHLVDEEIMLNPHYESLEDYCVQQSAWQSPDGDLKPLLYSVEQCIVDY